MNLLAIAIGGALGSVARYLLSSIVLRVSGPMFPLGPMSLVFSAPLNQVQGPVKTDFGYHLIEITKRG